MRGFDIFDLLVRLTEMKPDASIARSGETSHYLSALPTRLWRRPGCSAHRIFLLTSYCESAYREIETQELRPAGKIVPGFLLG
jgi:hypothetical protein